MKSLTAKQQAMLSFIEQFVNERHYPPTYEEIRVGLGLSTKSLVDYHLNALEAAGRIQRDPWTPRGLRVLLQVLFVFGSKNDGVHDAHAPLVTAAR